MNTKPNPKPRTKSTLVVFREVAPNDLRPVQRHVLTLQQRVGEEFASRMIQKAQDVLTAEPHIVELAIDAAPFAQPQHLLRAKVDEMVSDDELAQDDPDPIWDKADKAYADAKGK